MLSSYRPHSDLFVFTKTQSLINQLSLSWGVQAFYYDKEEGIDQVIADQHQILIEKGLLKPGDVVVNTGSIPIQAHMPTNMLKVTRIA
jgi:pyruvate kinase